jgi:hypothetical protein
MVGLQYSCYPYGLNPAVVYQSLELEESLPIPRKTSDWRN